MVDCKLNASAAHDVAEAFIAADRKQSKLHAALVEAFGFHCARTYAIDMSVAQSWRITFSRRVHPKVLLYRGAPALIADEHALALKLYITEAKPLFGVELSAIDTLRPAYLHN
jgi:hypothetical protein